MRRFVALASGVVTLVAAKENPIRKVVTLLQEMAEEIEGEIAKEKKMYEKFQCFCKKNDGELGAKAKKAAELIKATRATVASNEAKKKALAEEVKKHKADRVKAESDLKAATKQRQEEKAKYDEATKEQRKTIDDLNKAVTALEKGMGRSFLQTGAGDYLQRVLSSNAASVAGLSISDQETLSTFLQSKKDFAPQGGEIVGILKTMKENFDESLGGIIGEEEEAVKAFLALEASLEDLIKTSGRSIEKKNETKGQVSVAIVEGKNLVAVTERQMGDDMKTLAQLKEACSGKGDEFQTRQEDAAAEVDAINQAIGVLNNDDALQLFNKTDTKAEESFIQSGMKKNSPVAEAIAILGQKYDQPALAMLAFTAKQALKGGAKKVDFSKVLKMIDDMVVVLKQEAEDDVQARETCITNFRDSEQAKKDTERAIDGLNATIEELAATIEKLAGVIKTSDEEIASAEKAQAEATEQRKEDNAEFITAVDLNNQAVALIQKAKNKLNKYYNPQMYKAPPPPELSPEEELVAGARTVLVQKHVQTDALVQTEDLPAGQPETWEAGDRKNKGQKQNSVQALMDLLTGDLNKDTTALEKDESLAQQAYEKLSADLSEQVAQSSKAKANAVSGKSEAEEAKTTAESKLSMKEGELKDLNQTIADLHASCDFILETFEERKAARENEVAGLTKAKAILSGAKFD